MADLRSNDFKIPSFAELAQLYSLSGSLQLPPMYSPLHHPSFANAFSGLNRKLVTPQSQVPASMSFDEKFRQRGAYLSRNMVTQPVHGPDERDFTFGQGLLPTPGLSNNNWYSNLLPSDLIHEALSQASMNGLHSLSAMPPTSILDPSSKPFSPRTTAAIMTPQVPQSGDNLEFLERDSNDNVVNHHSKISCDYDGRLEMNKIWACVAEANKRKAPDVSPSDAGLKFFAPENFPPLVRAEDKSEGLAQECFEKSDETFVDLSHANDEPDDKFGLRSLAKSLRNGVYGDLDHTEEVQFLEKCRQISPGPLHMYLESPFSKQPVSPLCLFPDSPEEYIKITTILANRLGGQQSMVQWPTEMLFFFFYMATNDQLQLIAGNILHSRGWRYSKSRGIWIARKKNTQPEFRSDVMESGHYQYFDVRNWRREVSYFTLKYDDLADRISGIPDDVGRLVQPEHFQREFTGCQGLI